PLPQSTTTETTVSTTVDWSDFTLGPNDLIQVAVFGQPELSSPPTGVRVATDGTLSLPLTGPISIGGMTTGDAAKAIESALATYLQRPAVSVSVVEYISRRFYIFGEVKNTGPFPMDRPITALEALSMSGGLLPSANSTQAVIIRRVGSEDVEVFAFNAETPGLDGLAQVRSEDFIFVQKSGAGSFSESVLPYLQGVGFTLSQLASFALAFDRISNDD
ncbi:MAG: polysaccharide export protein, partial [Polyangiaceae bacterium]|nr:polysaccharide export protein [Polyangiaceae bacterium]